MTTNEIKKGTVERLNYLRETMTIEDCLILLGKLYRKSMITLNESDMTIEKNIAIILITEIDIVMNELRLEKTLKQTANYKRN